MYKRQNKYCAIIEHRELELCDYSLVGEFREKEINLGIEYKAWDNFLSDPIDDMEDKLTRSNGLYSDVAFFVETGNYTFKPIADNCHCNLEYTGAAKTAMLRNGNKEPKSHTLAGMEGLFETLQANGVHVRQLRGEAQFPYSLHNLLIYLTHPHKLKVKNLTYEAWLINLYTSIPEIGYVRAKNLIQNYPNPFWLCSAGEDSLIKVLGRTTGRVVYQHLRSHELETDEWKCNFHKDGTKADVHICDTCSKDTPELCDADSDNTIRKEDCVVHCDVYRKKEIPATLDLSDSNKITAEIAGAIISYCSIERRVEEICEHFGCGNSSEDKETLLRCIKKLAWTGKLTSTTLGKFISIVSSHQPGEIVPFVIPSAPGNDINSKSQGIIPPNTLDTPGHETPGVHGHPGLCSTLPPIFKPGDKSQQGSFISSSPAAPPKFASCSGCGKNRTLYENNLCKDCIKDGTKPHSYKGMIPIPIPHILGWNDSLFSVPPTADNVINTILKNRENKQVYFDDTNHSLGYLDFCNLPSMHKVICRFCHCDIPKEQDDDSGFCKDSECVTNRSKKNTDLIDKLKIYLKKPHTIPEMVKEFGCTSGYTLSQVMAGVTVGYYKKTTDPNKNISVFQRIDCI